MRRLELTGQRFNECVVTGPSHVNTLGKSVWSCVCDCGQPFTALGSELRSGHTRSCGCYSRSGTFNITHGYRRSGKNQHPLYTLWINIKERCGNPNHPHFEDYGGRGITICDEWKDSFETFVNYIISTIGEKPPKVEGYKRYWSLDRTDNNGYYKPGNIRWSDPTSQKLNQRPRRWHKRPVEGTV